MFYIHTHIYISPFITLLMLCHKISNKPVSGGEALHCHAPLLTKCVKFSAIEESGIGTKYSPRIKGPESSPAF
jgi:hypothetical protein